MAKKSKTQRAKASAARAARKEARQAEAAAEALKQAQGESADTEAPKKKLFGKFSQTADSAKDAKQSKAVEKKAEKKAAKPKKKRFQFLRDVKAEMKRVTWPSRQDVLRWSVVVVAALLFFGIYVAVLDNGIITPLLFLISGLGA
ncbi:preprotein translocase subunit SecE [Senegalimassilia anaerobia]